MEVFSFRKRRRRRDPVLERAVVSGFRINALNEYPFCGWCAEPLDADTATVDHIRPSSLGGANRPDNFVLACGPCNGKKSSADWGWPPYRPDYLQEAIEVAAAEYRLSDAARKRSLWRASRMVSLNIPMPEKDQ